MTTIYACPTCGSIAIQVTVWAYVNAGSDQPTNDWADDEMVCPDCEDFEGYFKRPCSFESDDPTRKCTAPHIHREHNVTVDEAQLAKLLMTGKLE